MPPKNEKKIPTHQEFIEGITKAVQELTVASDAPCPEDQFIGGNPEIKSVIENLYNSISVYSPSKLADKDKEPFRIRLLDIFSEQIAMMLSKFYKAYDFLPQTPYEAQLAGHLKLLSKKNEFPYTSAIAAKPASSSAEALSTMESSTKTNQEAPPTSTLPETLLNTEILRAKQKITSLDTDIQERKLLLNEFEKITNYLLAFPHKDVKKYTDEMISDLRNESSSHTCIQNSLCLFWAKNIYSIDDNKVIGKAITAKVFKLADVTQSNTSERGLANNFIQTNFSNIKKFIIQFYSMVIAKQLNSSEEKLNINLLLDFLSGMTQQIFQEISQTDSVLLPQTAYEETLVLHLKSFLKKVSSDLSNQITELKKPTGDTPVARPSEPALSTATATKSEELSLDWLPQNSYQLEVLKAKRLIATYLSSFSINSFLLSDLKNAPPTLLELQEMFPKSEKAIIATTKRLLDLSKKLKSPERIMSTSIQYGFFNHFLHHEHRLKFKSFVTKNHKLYPKINNEVYLRRLDSLALLLECSSLSACAAVSIASNEVNSYKFIISSNLTSNQETTGETLASDAITLKDNIKSRLWLIQKLCIKLKKNLTPKYLEATSEISKNIERRKFITKFLSDDDNWIGQLVHQGGVRIIHEGRLEQSASKIFKQIIIQNMTKVIESLVVHTPRSKIASEVFTYGNLFGSDIEADAKPISRIESGLDSIDILLPADYFIRHPSSKINSNGVHAEQLIAWTSKDRAYTLVENAFGVSKMLCSECYDELAHEFKGRPYKISGTHGKKFPKVGKLLSNKLEETGGAHNDKGDDDDPFYPLRKPMSPQNSFDSEQEANDNGASGQPAMLTL